MKRYILLLGLFLAISTTGMAQSMTDQQVMQFVIEQHQQGVSQQQIVTKLMQKGAKIDQIRRLRNQYDDQLSKRGLSAAADGDIHRNRNREQAREIAGM